MDINKKGRDGGDRATPKTSADRNPTAATSHVKAAIVRLHLEGT